MEKYIKNHPYGIEERAKTYFGTTHNLEFAGYILEDGSLLNFSHEGFQRDCDHREIGQFFSKAQSTEAMLKFMRRKNIRCINSKTGYRFEYIAMPTDAQIAVMRAAYYKAYRNGIEFLIEKDNSRGKAECFFYNLDDFLYFENIA